MFTFEQMEIVKQGYIAEIAEYQDMLNEDIKLKDCILVKREVSRRFFEKCGKDENYNQEYEERIKIHDGHIKEFTEELEDLNSKLEIINTMIEEVKA